MSRVRQILLSGALALGSLLPLAAATGCNREDECDPRAFTARCGERQGTRRACVRVDGDDYLLVKGEPHYAIEVVSCPRTRPTCVEAEGGAVCSGK